MVGEMVSMIARPHPLPDRPANAERHRQIDALHLDRDRLPVPERMIEEWWSKRSGMLVRPSRQPLSDRCQTLAANARSMLSTPDADRVPAAEPRNGLTRVG